MDNKCNTKRYTWTEDNLRLAIEAVKSNELNIRQAGIKYGIPAKTLSRRLESGVLTKYGKLSTSRLGIENEQELVKYIKNLEKTGYIHTRLEIRKIAYDYAKKKNLEHIFDQNKSLAGAYWLETFLRRHPEVKVQKEKQLDNDSNSTDNDDDDDGEISENFEQMNDDEENSKDMDFPLHFENDIPEDEKNFYIKFYPLIDQVANRKIHCTVCDQHIGTAPCQESLIRMHPIMKVTHCKKCHEFYNSGEFSKGEDGSELYCRWCGQGGEVYCCSKCPYVFCKNCIILNLSQNIINDIEENENWNCFVCAPKIMWPLRAQHWALMNFIEKQKKLIVSKNYSESEVRRLMIRDQSTCCGNKSSLPKRPSTKISSNVSDSSCESENSATLRKRRTDNKYRRILPKPLFSDSDSCDDPPEPKKQKSNDEVVCTPDVLSMLQTENSTTSSPQKSESVVVKEKQVQIQQKPTVIQQKPKTQLQHVQRPSQQRQSSTPVQIQNTSLKAQTQQSSAAAQTHPPQQQPPPLVIRNYSGPLRAATPTVVTRKTIVGPRPPSATGQAPVYHTINGFRIDLNSAAQHETFRLPNGKLIQVKRQGTAPNNINLTSAVHQTNTHTSTAPVNVHNQMIRTHLNTRTPHSQTIITQQGNQTVQQITLQQPPQLATIRYSTTPSQSISGNTTITAAIPTQGGTVLLNGTAMQQVARPVAPNTQPVLTRQFFSATPLGQSRSQLQNQIFTAMEQCQYLSGKIHSLTNSNAYKGVKNFSDVKELYIHLSYLFTYAIGRFKSLQEKCLEDMKKLGFTGDATTLQSGQRVSDKPNNDGDDDDIEIVEPKTTCIDLDSDNEDGQSITDKKNCTTARKQEAISKLAAAVNHSSPTPNPSLPISDSNPANKTSDDDIDITTGLLAEMLDVELHEGGDGSEEAGEKASSPSESSNSGISSLKKPRKKTTNKPNPHLLKQMELQQLERSQEIIRCDTKLSSECSVVLEKVDDTKYNKLSGDFNVEEETTKERKGGNVGEDKQKIKIVENSPKSIDKEKFVVDTPNESIKTSNNGKQSCDLDESIIVKILNETDKNSNLEETKISKESKETEGVTIDAVKDVLQKENENIEQDDTSLKEREHVSSGDDDDVEMKNESNDSKEDFNDENEKGNKVKGREDEKEEKEEDNGKEKEQEQIKKKFEEEEEMDEKEEDMAKNRKKEEQEQKKKEIVEEKKKNEIEEKNEEAEVEKEQIGKEIEKKQVEKEVEVEREKEIENNENSILDSIKSFDMIDESSKTQDSLFESISDATFDVTDALSTAEIESCLKFNEDSEKNECSSDNFFMVMDDNAVQCESENI